MARRKQQTVREPLSSRFMKHLVSMYLFLMFIIYPLYYENKYYNMGEAKWHFFRFWTYGVFKGDPEALIVPITPLIFLAGFLWYQYTLYKEGLLKKSWNPRNMSVVDLFVLIYAVAVIISALLAQDKSKVIWGYKGWFMGLAAQMAFVLIYYFVSRFWRWDEVMLILYLAASSIVYIFGICNRFLIDPLQMYVGLDAYYIPQFLSTLGQATWYSSFVCSVFPIGMFAYWHYDNRIVRILSGIYVALGFMTMITQDSDSAFFAFLAMFSALFFFSFDSMKHIKRFVEILIIGFASWKVIGLLQLAFPEQAVEIGALMTFVSQSPLTWVLVVIPAAIYYFLLRFEKKEAGVGMEVDVSKFRIVRTLYFALLIAGLAAAVLYIALNTMGVLPESLSSTNNYLLFDDRWGSNRGSSWMISVSSFLKVMKDDPLTAIFGIGPDSFYNLVYRYHSADLIAKWGENTTLTCAHNEWMTAIINIGIVGGLSYLGIFLSSIRRFGSNVDKYTELVAPVMCICSYMAHNFFCYQQIICTPMIFIIIGAGEAICRVGLHPIYEPEDISRGVNPQGAL